MKRKTKIIITGFLLAAVLFTCSYWQENQENTFPPGQLIRLHIVANSDCKDDQELKRKVRDEIIRNIAADFQKAKDIDTARVIAESRLHQIREVARNEIAAEGKDYPVEVELGNFAFPTKHYGPFILPAGEYESVQVTIGSGDGANWWCVLFPPLCFVDMSRGITISADDLPTDTAAGDENFTSGRANCDDNKLIEQTPVEVQASSVSDIRITSTLEEPCNTVMPGEITKKIEFRFRILEILKCFID
ncbi:MAG: Stage II sporulation protein R (spore_II_R) [Pelotomaculum sp. PtaB.Bin104]|nr:MAG: Stage II sporulation protein R (spore_II_R) [Pelotomaculum sp. PtaB.Bin104]